MQLTRVFPVIKSAAFLICDVQERFRPLIWNMNTVIHRTQLLNNVCNILSIPCIISEQNPKALGSTVSEVTQYPGTYVYPKTKFSMITDEVNDRFLQEPKQIIICGIESHVCVYQTTMDLLTRGHDVIIACDAVSSQRPYDRTVALESLRAAGAYLTTVESLIFLLLKDASHPHFKQISGLIKNYSSYNLPNEFGSSTSL